MESLESLEETAARPPTKGEPEYKPSRYRNVGVIIFGVVTFVFFLMMKLPEARIQNLVIAHLRILAQEQGLLFSAEKVRIGVLLGPSLKMYNVELKSIDNERQALKIPYLRVRPQLLSLLTGTKKVGLTAEMLDGELSGTVGASNTGFVADLSIDTLDLGTTNLLRKFLPVDLSAKLSGRINLDMDTVQSQKSDGSIVLSIKELDLPPQNLFGFNLPKVKIGESKIDISITKGNIAIRTFEIGKDAKTDDLAAKVTGDGQIDQRIEYSRLVGKVVFELSQSVIQSFPLLDALLGPAKQSDGKYVYRFNGPIAALEAQPGG